MIRLDWRGSGLAGRQLEAAVAAGLASREAPGHCVSRHAPGTNLREAIGALGIDPDARMLVMLGDRRIDAAALTSTIPDDGAEIALLPSLRAG